MILLLKVLDTSHDDDRGLKVKVCGEVVFDRLPANFSTAAPTFTSTSTASHQEQIKRETNQEQVKTFFPFNSTSKKDSTPFAKLSTENSDENPQVIEENGHKS